MTEPAQPSATPAAEQYRDVASSFGSDPERYDRARPRYPAALYEVILAGLPGRAVLDVGVGTGLSSLPLCEAGCDVLGLDVDSRMAALAEHRGIPVHIGRFEDWEAGGRRFDAVIAGQTWHWIDPERGVARAAEILRPGGRLALFWNAGDPPPDLAEAFAEVYRAAAPALPFTPFAGSAVDGYLRGLSDVSRVIRANGAFNEPERHRFDWTAEMSTSAWLDQVPTFGGFHRLPPDQRATLLRGMADIVDAAGGSFTMQYSTVMLTATRRPESG